MHISAKLFGLIAILATTVANAEITTDVVCSYAPSQNVAINRVISGVGGAGAGAAALLEATGMTAVIHSSGGYILTSSGGYVAGTLGGATIAPILMTASVVVGGSAIFIELTCAPKNHPNAIATVKKYTAEFNKALGVANEKAIGMRDSANKSIRTTNDKAIDVRDAANDKAIEFRDEASRLYAKGSLNF